MTPARKLLMGAAAVAFLLVLAITAQLAGGNSGVNPLPQPNGYDLFVKAGLLATDTVSDYPNLSEPELRSLMETNAAALQLLRRGLMLTCSVPTEAGIKNFNTIFPDLPRFKRLAYLLAAEGRLAEMQKRPADAAQSYAEAVALGNEISRGGFLIHRLVGVAIQAIGATRLASLIPQLDGQEARRIAELLDRTDAGGVTWDEINHNENIFFRHQLRQNMNPVTIVTSWWGQRPAKQKAKLRHELAIAHVRLMRTELGLRSYAMDHGHNPTRLEELVPLYVSRLPEDPFTGRPLVYKPQGTNWALYSLGPDGVDNGGTGAPRGSMRGDVLYFSPW